MRVRPSLIAVVFSLLPLLSLAYTQELESRITESVQKAVEELKKEISRLITGKFNALSVSEDATAIEIISQRLLEDHLGYLASDKLEGRLAGSQGEKLAAEYIIKEFTELGLKPVGDKDEKGNLTYTQKFEFRSLFLKKKINSLNILGLLEGTDPKLKKQIVVVGAHFDHIGKGRTMLGLRRPTKDDDIFNGADDNASGTSTVLAIARAFVKSKTKTKRSILFILFGAEEIGLLGSRHYVKNPIAPLNKHVVMVNFDMVGRNPDRSVTIQGVGTAKGNYLGNFAQSAIRKTGLKAKLIKSGDIGFGSSDHATFTAKGIPSLFFFTGLHRDYHGIDDEPDRIAYDNMEKIAETGYYLIKDLANAPEEPEFAGKIMPEIEEEEIHPVRRVRLGIYPTYDVSEEELENLKLDKNQGAIKIEEVIKGTVAEKAGIKPGDYIISFDGKNFSRDNPLRDLSKYLAEVKEGKPVKITVLRDGKKIELTAVWGKPVRKRY